MKKTFKNYGELKVINAEEWCKLSFNPYRFSEGWARATDGTVCEIYSGGNASKKMGIPMHIAVEG